jgi:hypothetical protein
MSLQVTTLIEVKPQEGPNFKLIVYGDCVEIQQENQPSLFLSNEDFEILGHTMGYYMSKED